MTNHFTAIIVDDERNARFNLLALIEAYTSDIAVIGTASNVSEAKELLNSSEIDIIFLDISMPNSSGFELVPSIDTSRQALVFVTAHEEYALQAFKAYAWHYITKPIDIDELGKISESIKERLTLLKESAGEEASDQENEKLSIDSTLSVSNNDGIKLLPIRNILSLTADGNYTSFVMIDTTMVVASKQLGYYEKILPKNFLRIHKSHIINLMHLKAYSSSNGKALMTDGTGIPISRRHLKSFLETIANNSKK